MSHKRLGTFSGFFGEQKDLYLKGRRAENYGLGIGAFTYLQTSC